MTTCARAATVGHRSCGRLVGSRGDDRAEHEPAADAGEEQVGVLAEPTEPGTVGDRPIDHRVVVGERDRALVGTTDRLGHRSQPGPQRCVVIDPRVPADPCLRARGRRRRIVLGQVRPRRHDHRPGPGYRSIGIGRPFRIAEREPHAVVQPAVDAFPDRAAGLDENVGRCDTDVFDSALLQLRTDLLDRRQRQRWLWAAHHQSVRGRPTHEATAGRRRVSAPARARRTLPPCRARSRRPRRTPQVRRPARPGRTGRPPPRCSRPQART